MVRVEGHRIIRAPVQKVYQLVSHVDSQPRVTGLWLSADLIERKGNTVTVHYRGFFGGMPIESIQRATLLPNQRVEFRQTRGALKAFRGEYVLKSVDSETDLGFKVEADVGIPLISENSAKLVLQSFVDRSLEKFKLTAERDLPRVVGARRPREAAAATGVAPPVGDALADLPAVEEPASPQSLPAPVPARPPQPAQPQRASAAGSAMPGQGKRRRRRRRRRRRGGGTRPPQGAPGMGPAPGSGPGNPGSA